MIELKLSTVADWMQATFYGKDQSFKGICIDSRSVQAGNIFVAIKGEKVDGHQFLEQVKTHGAVAAIVDAYQANVDLPQLKVENTVLALGRLSHQYRQGFSLPLAAVTGSSGKTTVKEMLASILSVSGPILASQGNLNTDVGLPLTLLGLSPEQRYGVVEMGARHKGDIRYLMSLAEPDVTLITNAGVAHIEIFGSERGIAEAKGEIYSGLKPNGTAVINLDDSNADYWKSLLTTQKIVTFALDAGRFPGGLSPDFSCINWLEKADGSDFELVSKEGKRKIALKAFGKHSVSNALAAAATAYALGIPMDEIVIGLEKFVPVAGRLQLKRGIEGSKIIDDTYNANPASVKAALAVLAFSDHKDEKDKNARSSGSSLKKIFVMGDMLELGVNGAELHREIGAEAKKLGIDKLYGIGNLTLEAIKGFGAGATHFNDKSSLIKHLKEERDLQHCKILVKGSRGMRMEEIVQAMIEIDTNSGSNSEPTTAEALGTVKL